MSSLVPRSALPGPWVTASPPSSAGHPTPETPPPLETGAAGPAPRSRNCLCSWLFPFPEQQRPCPRAALLHVFAPAGRILPLASGQRRMGPWSPSTLISSRMVCGPHLRCSLLNMCPLFNVWTGGEFCKSLRPGCFLHHNSFFDSFLSSHISLSAAGRTEPLHQHLGQEPPLLDAQGHHVRVLPHPGHEHRDNLGKDLSCFTMRTFCPLSSNMLLIPPETTPHWP